MNRLDFRHLLIAVVAFVTGHFLPASVAGAAPPTSDALQAQIQQLQTQVMRLEQTTRSAATSANSAPVANTTEVQIAQLTENVGRILQVLQITPEGVTIETDGNLLLTAGRDVSVRASRQLLVHGQTKTEMTSDGTLSMSASGRTDLRGGLVAINNGGKRVASQGGKTSGGATSQIIMDGSPTVLVP